MRWFESFVLADTLDKMCITVCSITMTSASLAHSHSMNVFSFPGAFFLYAGLAVLGFFFVLGCLPETKGLMLEDIETLFSWRLCTCGASDSESAHYIRVKGGNLLSDEDISDVE